MGQRWMKLARGYVKRPRSGYKISVLKTLVMKTCWVCKQKDMMKRGYGRSYWRWVTQSPEKPVSFGRVLKSSRIQDSLRIHGRTEAKCQSGASLEWWEHWLISDNKLDTGQKTETWLVFNFSISKIEKGEIRVLGLNVLVNFTNQI